MCALNIDSNCSIAPAVGKYTVESICWNQNRTNKGSDVRNNESRWPIHSNITFESPFQGTICAEGQRFPWRRYNHFHCYSTVKQGIY